jgi:hypothetical protein
MAVIPKGKMMSQQQIAECVLSFHESKSVTTDQDWFQTKFRRKPPLKEMLVGQLCGKRLHLPR